MITQDKDNDQSRDLLPSSSTRPFAESGACQIADGWNRPLTRIHPDAHPKRIERGASAVSANGQ